MAESSFHQRHDAIHNAGQFVGHPGTARSERLPEPDGKPITDQLVMNRRQVPGVSEQPKTIEPVAQDAKHAAARAFFGCRMQPVS